MLLLWTVELAACRIAGKRGGNKFLISSRPLDSDEMFHFRLDKVAAGTKDSTLLHFGLVDFKSKRNEEQMWTIVSSHILSNGEELEKFPTLNFDTLQVINTSSFKYCNSYNKHAIEIEN